MSEPVVVATGGDAPSVDEQAAGQASAAAGASAVLAGQAEQAAAQARQAAQAAQEGAAVASGAEGAAEAAQQAARDAAESRTAVESFIETQTRLNHALLERLEHSAAPPPPALPPEAAAEVKAEEPKPDRAPARREHWINRPIGKRGKR